MFENAKWVTCGKNESNPLIIKVLKLNEIERVDVAVCGLGFYELFVNGKRVGNEFYKPSFSDYSKRDFTLYTYPLEDETSHTVYYNVYDITQYIIKGDNVFSLLLGNGYYRQNERLAEGNTSFNDSLIAVFDITVREINGETKHIYSDGSERYIKSFIEKDNLFLGEVQNYKEFSFPLAREFSNYKKVTVTNAPTDNIVKQNCPPDRIVRVVSPKLISDNGSNKIFDVGENIVGNVEFFSCGENVIIKHAENFDGVNLDYNSTGGVDQIYCCEYYNAEKGKKLFPYFSWGGFRYFEISGKVDSVKVNVIHSDVSVIASFNSDNETLNWLFDAYIRTQLNNMHCGVPTDCPHRERLGYTGDAHLTMENALLTLDSSSFYRKWLKDLRDCQDIKSGHIQHTAPFCGGGGGPGGWGGAMILCPYYFYKITGDKSVIEENYDNMLKYLQCMKEFSENGLIVKERKNGWCLGEWGTPGKVLIPEPFINTYYYIKCLEIFTFLSSEIGKIVDYSNDIEYSKKALKTRYYDGNKNCFCNGIQGANVFALSLGLGNEEMKKSLIEHYKTTRVFDVGIFGLSVLSDYLVQIGEIQLLYDLLTTDKYPSFHYMKNNNATTIWEAWDGSCSHDHPMYCSFIKQFFYGFLGINANVGMKDISVKPHYIKGLKFVEGSVKTAEGKTFFVRHDFIGGKVETQIKYF